MNLTPDQRRLASWFGVVAVLVGVAWVLGPVLQLFVLAVVIAYALAPAVDALVRWTGGKCPRVVAALLVEVVCFSVVLGLMLLIVPILAQEIPMLRDRLPQLLDNLQAWAQPYFQQLGIPVQLNLSSGKQWLLSYFSTNGEDLLKSALSSLKVGGSYALAMVANAVLVPVAVFFLLMDWDDFVHVWLKLIPPRLRPAVTSFAEEANTMLGHYLRGQVLVMLALGAYYSIALKLFGLKLFLSIGVFTGLMSFVPYVGFGLGLLLAGLAGLLQFSPSYALIMLCVVYGLGQLLESFVLTPRLVGERIGLHPLTVIFALMLFAQLFGFVGMMVALPVCAVLQVLFARLARLYHDSHFYRDAK